MARVFVSFAVEDEALRNLLNGQKVNSRSAIEYTDYSVKEPWSERWKTQCRDRIKLCRGMISIITHNTPKADGQLWEMKCAIEESVPLFLIHGYSAPEKKAFLLPHPFTASTVYDWTEANIIWFLNYIEAR